MNSLEMLLAKPIFQALGWALVHFIWQGAVVAIFYAGVSALLRRRSANVRYGLACASMVLMLAFPVATIFMIEQASSRALKGGHVSIEAPPSPAVAPQSESLAQSPTIIESVIDSSATARSLSFEAWAKQRFAEMMPWLVALWFAGVLFLSLRFLGGLVVTRRLKRKETSRAIEQWQENLLSLCHRVRVSRPVRLCESALVEVPTVIGWLRPVILVPTSALVGLSREQLEALLAHELAHIRRYDYLINLLQTAVETLLFYHPAVWWLSAQIRQEREHCCDDLAVATCGNVLIYARALAELEQLRTVAPQLAVAASGGKLITRIQRLIGSPARSSHRFESWLAGVIALAIVLGILAGAQTANLADDKKEAAARGSIASQSPDSSARPSAANRQRDQEKSLDKTRDALSGQEDEKGKDGQSVDAASTAAEDETVEPEQPVQESRSSGSGDFINDLATIGYTKLSVDDLISLKTHGVTVEYIREMNALFNQKLSVDTLTAMMIHGVTTKFMSDVKAMGYANLSADDLVAFRIHGVTTEYISGWKNAGYANLSADEITAFAIHGVTPAFVQEMKALGFNKLDPDDLMAFKIHGVSAQFVQAMRSYIHGNLSADDLTGMRIHGVTPEFIKEMESLGLTNLSADDLMGFKIHGVTASFIKAIQSLGYKPSADELQGLMIHGVTPEFIQSVKSRGFTDLTLEQVIELRRLNIIPGSRKK
ncbi:MAG TPA: M56 family metallopeptidase [Blastocatellia bacterium]|nr:M56 family metallopeptidase [Blastocatellia bacterium]